MLLHWWTFWERAIIGQKILLIFKGPHLVRTVFFSVLSSCAYIFSLDTHFSLCLKMNYFLHSVPSDMDRNRHFNLTNVSLNLSLLCRAFLILTLSRGKSKFFFILFVFFQRSFGSFDSLSHLVNLLRTFMWPIYCCFVVCEV